MKAISLTSLGYNSELEAYRVENKLNSFNLGLVISEHKERYVIKTPEQEYEGEITGNIRFSAQSRSDFPVVGDWVSISKFDENKVIIYNILPRRNTIERQAVGKFGETQIIASNIDYAFIIQAVDRDFSLNRIERYLTICYNSKVSPVVIINKTDLVDEDTLNEISKTLKKRFKTVEIIFLSNTTKKGLSKVQSKIYEGKTYCLLGSSGVGKSSLLNNLLGAKAVKTDSVSEFSQRGKHVTTHRELFVLENGGLLIDNPGMRELGVTDSKEGIEITFNELYEIAQDCKFKDCKHINETGCAVLEAVETGILSNEIYENYLKLNKEQEFFEMDSLQKRKRDKNFGKMLKQVKKDIKKYK